jgi:uncharacterized protein (TIGR02246 family)
MRAAHARRAIGAPMPVDAEAVLQLLLDERELRTLMLSFGSALDRKDWTAYAGTFAADGAFEIMGQRRVGREAIAAGPARDLASFAGLQHLVANQTAEVDGDDASGQWYLFGIHVPDGERRDRHADIGGCYRYRARRTADGWRFSDVRLEVLWTSGLTFGIDEREDTA